GNEGGGGGGAGQRRDGDLDGPSPPRTWAGRSLLLLPLLLRAAGGRRRTSCVFPAASLWSRKVPGHDQPHGTGKKSAADSSFAISASYRTALSAQNAFGGLSSCVRPTQKRQRK